MDTAIIATEERDAPGSRVGLVELPLDLVHRVIAAAIAVLLLGAAWSLVLVHVLGLGDTLLGEASVRLFFLDGEQGLPAAFSAALILCAAGATLLASRAMADTASMSRYAWRWRVLAALLALFALDEAFVIHENFGAVLGRVFGLSGMLWHTWVIPYGLVALTVGALSIRPLRALPSRTRTLILAGGICYVVGAAGMELMASRLAIVDASRLVRDVGIFIEESLEMAGMWLFLAGMLTLLRGTSWRLSLT